jgi:hypothetical protein
MCNRARSRPRSSGPVVPLSSIQSELLRLLASHRSPESYVAGAVPLNRDGPRFSDDIDVFHDREESVAAAAIADTEVLDKAGFAVSWLRREPGIYGAVVERNRESTKLEWLRDGDFRFFPTLPDDLFGYVLHAIDIATNKALAAAGRREPRDVLDLLTIHDRHVPIGAVVWAAVAKEPGFAPESLLAEIRRNARYRQDDYADLALAEPVDAGLVSRRLRAALESAEAFVRAMPAGKEGLVFLKDGQVVQPNPMKLGDHTEHAGRRYGHWPSSSEISGAMLGRYR